MAMDSTKVLNGTFGKLIHDGTWMTNVTSCEASVEINKEEINRAGTRWVGHKVTSISGSGTFSGYRLTSDLVKKIGQISNDGQGAFVTELIMAVSDPEAGEEGKTKVRLKNVQFDSIPLLSFEVGTIIEQETPFTFSGYEFLQ